MASSKSSEGVKNTHSLRDFKGVNTQAARQSIGDDEFSWLENVVPIGFGNLRALPGPSTALATWSPSIAYNIQTANLNNVDYLYVFTTDGAGYQVNLTTYAVTTFAPASTFSGSGTAMCQWQNTQICIIDPDNGYFSWNGSTLTLWTGTIQDFTVTAIGTGYTSSPTLSIAAPSSGTTATATADIQLGLAVLDAAGTGYEVNDVLTIAGGTVGPLGPAQLTVSAIGSSGAITGANLTFPGDYTVAPSNPASVTGGYGSSATFNLNFGIGSITLTNPGSGYTADPAVTITSGSGSGGAITANLSVVPSSGTAIASYGGRIWVGDNRTMIFSAPSSFSDFTPSNAGGSFVFEDETLHSSIQSLLSANNYLYVLGSTSVDIISGVQVVSGSTIFSETNISASIGSAQPLSVLSFYRAIMFATPYGFYSMSGTTPQKSSDHLDGIFPLIGNGIPVSAGTVVIFNVICPAFMFQYLDPVQGARALIAVLFNKKWLFVSQGNSLTMMTTSLIGGTPTLYATDGLSLYELLENPSSPIIQTVATKLWDMEDPTRDKQTLKVGIEAITPSIFNEITGTVDTEITTNSATFSAIQGSPVNWVNNFGQTIQWVNTSNSYVTWLGGGYNFNKADVETCGKYIGISLSGSAPGQIYSAFHLQYEKRAIWTTMPT